MNENINFNLNDFHDSLEELVFEISEMEGMECESLELNKLMAWLEEEYKYNTHRVDVYIFVLWVLFYKRIFEINSIEIKQLTKDEKLKKDLFNSNYNGFKISEGFFLKITPKKRSELKNNLKKIFFEIKQLNYAFHDIYKGIPLIDNIEISNSEISIVIDWINTINISPKFVNIELMGDIYEATIKKLLYIHYNIPGHLTLLFENEKKLVVDLMNPKAGESIYDPFANSGELLTACHKHIIKNESTLDNTKYVAMTPFSNINSVIKMNLIMNGVKDFYVYQSQNFFSFIDKILPGTPEKFDLSISSPPFGLIHLGQDKYSLFDDPYGFKKIELAKQKDSNLYNEPSAKYKDMAFANHMLSKLEKNGRMAIIVPNSSLFKSGNEKTFRKNILDNDYIEAVIELPWQKEHSYEDQKELLIINKNKDRNRTGLIIFIKTNKSDGIDDYFKLVRLSYKEWRNISGTSKIISTKNILNTILSPSLYVNKDKVNLDDIFKEDKLVEIHELVKDFIRGKKHIKNNNEMKKEIFFVQGSDLSDSQIDSKLNYNKIKIKVKKSKNLKIIKQVAVLICLSGNNLKPTLFDGDKEIALGVDVEAIVLKENKVLPEYFIYELYKENMLCMMDIYRSGISILSYTTLNIIKIKLSIPSLKDQKLILDEFRLILYHKEKEKIFNKLNLKEIVKKREENILSTITHNLRTPIASIKNDIQVLNNYCKEKENIYKDHIVDVHEDDELGDIDTVETVLSRCLDNIESSFDTIERTGDLYRLNNSSLKIVPVDLKEFFRNKLVKLYPNHPKFNITITGEKSIVLVDEKYFLDVFRNIIDNAIKHGFIESKKYEILLDFKTIRDKSEDKIKVKILYSNNGEPFPKGFTFEKFLQMNERAGIEKGSGIGGAFINKVIELHNGKIEKNNTKAGVSFSIELPGIKE